jgi:segregation and condensation protein A
MFRVDLDIYRGPLDLLLYLVKRHELDVHDIPIALIAEQYLTYLEVLEQLDVNAVGDFLEMASTLVEIKSQLVLPRVAETTDEVIDDPREELVERLLEYKKFKDVASILEERSRRWQQRYPRMADDLPPRKSDPADQPIHEVELWDLVSAFARVVRDNASVQPTTIVYDDTPIHVWMQRIHRRLVETQECTFSEMFAAGMHKSALVGVFLAILELCRHHSVVCEQATEHGEILIRPGDNFRADVEFGEVDDYEHKQQPDPQEQPPQEKPTEAN